MAQMNNHSANGWISSIRQIPKSRFLQLGKMLKKLQKAPFWNAQVSDRHRTTSALLVCAVALNIARCLLRRIYTGVAGDFKLMKTLKLGFFLACFLGLSAVHCARWI